MYVCALRRIATTQTLLSTSLLPTSTLVSSSRRDPVTSIPRKHILARFTSSSGLEPPQRSLLEDNDHVKIDNNVLSDSVESSHDVDAALKDVTSAVSNTRVSREGPHSTEAADPAVDYIGTTSIPVVSSL
jgi:hypothetical protein